MAKFSLEREQRSEWQTDLYKLNINICPFSALEVVYCLLPVYALLLHHDSSLLWKAAAAHGSR